jgi:dTDP-4-dehydrorhamnose reductase
MMRILITGANGQLGNALQRILHGEDLILKDLPEFDLTTPACADQILAAKPQIVLHAGAYTNVDQAEREPERAHAVNAEGTQRVADAAEAIHARLLYLSTDYVFDGTKGSPYREDDDPHPLNQYGLSKLKGEQAVLKRGARALIVRTSWVFGREGHNFVKTIMKAAHERSVLEVVADQRGCPTYAEDLARALRELAFSDLRGICHVTNTGDCSWFEFAQAILQQTGAPAVIRPITTAQAARPAKRPVYSVLSHDRFAARYEPLPHWQDALARFMRHGAPVLPA